MRQTGIVRRMDELGRVVIPKELRRTMRLREGEEVEVTQKDDMLIIRKFSAVGEMIDFQLEYASSIYRTTGYTAIITDYDKIIAHSGDLLKVTYGTLISEKLRDVIDGRKTETYLKGEILPCFEGADVSQKGQVIAPIISAGDVKGAVIILTRGKLDETAIKTAETASCFLGERV